MDKTIKAALAATTAGVLLVGGAGTLANWSATETVTGDDFSSGTLSLSDLDATAASWELNGVEVTDPATVLLVPGDELSFTEVYEIGATGDNLQGTLDVTGGVFSGALATHVTGSSTFTLNDTVPAVVAADETFTEANDGDTVTVALTVDFPFAAGNTSQGLLLDLTDVVITMTQTDASA